MDKTLCEIPFNWIFTFLRTIVYMPFVGFLFFFYRDNQKGRRKCGGEARGGVLRRIKGGLGGGAGTVSVSNAVSGETKYITPSTAPFGTVSKTDF